MVLRGWESSAHHPAQVLGELPTGRRRAVVEEGRMSSKNLKHKKTDAHAHANQPQDFMGNYKILDDQYG